MRLINVHTKRLKTFQNPTQPYAILSHTWGEEEEELSFQDMQALDRCGSAQREKLDRCCEQARKHNIDYIWIDTCCIDKTNAVELSSAINSMFRWYQKSELCYAYLADVEPGQSNQISKSRWFTRGWTLQELLAPQDPKKMIFFDSAWAQLGTKSSLWEAIRDATGIPHAILTGITNPQSCSVAQRMSWASRRETTVLEDMAYCLLGVFNIILSPIYGEGLESAFYRLQVEIMKKTPDDSILAWSLEQMEAEQEYAVSPAISGGVLATSPAAFKLCGGIVQRSTSHTETHVQAFDTPGGKIPISMSLCPSPTMTGSSSQVVYGYLSCGPKNNPSRVAAIPLVQCQTRRSSAHARPVFLRPRGLNTIYLPMPSETPTPETIWICNNRASDVTASNDESYWLYLEPPPSPGKVKIGDIFPVGCFERDKAMIKTPREQDFGTEQNSVLFLVRFSYSPFNQGERDSVAVAASQFILALEFFRESAVGGKNPRVCLYCDSVPPTPLPLVESFWPSLACAATTEIMEAFLPPSTLRASIKNEATDQHRLWVVSLSSDDTSRDASSPSFTPRWPHIKDQMEIRRDCCSLVRLVLAQLSISSESEECARAFDGLNGEIDTTTRELQQIREEIALLKAQEETLQSKLEGQTREQLGLRERTELLKVNLDAVSNDVTEMESRKSVQSVWPATPDPVAKRKWDDARRRDHDGVIRYIMDNEVFEQLRLRWVPGMTLLMYAAATGDPELICRVLRYDSDIETEDSSNQTALDWATWSGLNDFMELVTRSKSLQPGLSMDSTNHDSKVETRPQLHTKAKNHSAGQTTIIASGTNKDRINRVPSQEVEQDVSSRIPPLDTPPDPRPSRHRRGTNSSSDVGLPKRNNVRSAAFRTFWKSNKGLSLQTEPDPPVNAGDFIPSSEVEDERASTGGQQESCISPTMQQPEGPTSDEAGNNSSEAARRFSMLRGLSFNDKQKRSGKKGGKDWFLEFESTIPIGSTAASASTMVIQLPAT